MDGKDPNGLLIIFKRGPAPVHKDDQEKKRRPEASQNSALRAGVAVASVRPSEYLRACHLPMD
jgi:hypothetical protein